MNRWKREPQTTLIIMHEHNRWSRWYGHLMAAARELGLVVGFTYYRNGSGDGSFDREWYVMTDQLESAGGMRAVRERAEKLREELERPCDDCGRYPCICEITV